MLIKQSSKYPIFFTLPICAYLLFTFYRHLNSDLYMSLLDTFDFYIHEIGHLVFIITWNQFITVLWGTLFQLIIPIACLIWFNMQKDYFAVSLCYAWIWTNFFYISNYSWDAIKQTLPLFWFWWWWDTIHDWTYIFTRLWVLDHTDLISNWFRFIAIWFFLIFIVYSLLLIINRFRE